MYISDELSWLSGVLTQGVHQLPDPREVSVHELLVLGAELTSCRARRPVELPQDVVLPALQLHQPGVGLEEPARLHQTLRLQHHAAHWGGGGGASDRQQLTQ